MRGGFIYPILGYIGELTIRSYWILNFAGIIAGFLLLFYNLKPYPKEFRDRIILFALILFVPFTLASRYGYVAEGFFNHEKGLSFSLFGQVSLWWGLIAAALCAFPAAKLLKTDPWQAADIFSFSLAAGGIFARLGCFFNGCCPGIPSPKNYFFGTFYSPYSYAYTVFGNVPLHPAQLYESCAWLIILILLYIMKKSVVYRGELILLTGACYAIARFFIEFFRYHEIHHLISDAQLFCIIVFLFASLMWIFKKTVLKKY
jgi:phosphatidylglycerol:prolipoprotein diacylglycerol transferase